MEGEAQVRLVFKGEVLEGCQADDVKRRFGETFKVDGARLDAIFSGERTVLKRAMPMNEATRYVTKLAKLGARVHVEPIDADALPDSPERASLKLSPATGAMAAPVTPLAAMEEQIECPNCGERQPKRAFCRACTTDIERAMASKKEDAERARAERLDAARAGSGDRWAAPRASVEQERGSGVLVDPPPALSLSFEGRMGRISYINAGAVAMGAVAIVGILAAVLIPLTRSLLLLIPAGLALMLFAVWSVRIMALRLHDFNRSGWWALISLVPYLGWLASLVLLFMPGSPEDNDFGDKPRQGNGLIAAIVIAVWLIGIVSMVVMGSRSYDKYVQRSHNAEPDVQADPAAVRYLHSPEAVGAFADYANQPPGKVFATGGGGAWGWQAGQGSLREAATKALANCDASRKAYTSACAVVNVNGAWVEERP